MKKRSLVLLLIASIGANVRAQDKVQPISDDVIQATFNELDAQDRLRTKIRLFAAGATAATAGYYLWRWYHPSEEKKEEKVTKEVSRDVENLKKQFKEFKEEYKVQEAAKVGVLEEDPWYKRWAAGARDKISNLPSGVMSLLSATKNAFGSYFPGIVAGMVITRVGTPFLNFLYPISTKVSNYLLLPHTISWFLEHKIHFADTIKQLLMWIDEDKNNGEIALSKQNFANKINSLVRDIEHILGFMQYVTSQLPEDGILEKESSVNLQSKIKSAIEMFSGRVNQFLETTHDEQTYSAASIVMSIGLKGTLFMVINTLQEFEFVQKGAGYEDIDLKSTFKSLRKLVKPQEINQDKEAIKKLVGKQLMTILANSPLGALLI